MKWLIYTKQETINKYEVEAENQSEAASIFHSNFEKVNLVKTMEKPEDIIDIVKERK